MFAKIRQQVTEGRWKLAGGWWVEPALPGFKTMQAMHSEIPPDSPWKANSWVPGNWQR